MYSHVFVAFITIVSQTRRFNNENSPNGKYGTNYKHSIFSQILVIQSIIPNYFYILQQTT